MINQTLPRTAVDHIEGVDMLSMHEALARAQMSARLGEAHQTHLVRRVLVARRLRAKLARAERVADAARVALAKAL